MDVVCGGLQIYEGKYLFFGGRIRLKGKGLIFVTRQLERMLFSLKMFGTIQNCIIKRGGRVGRPND